VPEAAEGLSKFSEIYSRCYLKQAEVSQNSDISMVLVDHEGMKWLVYPLLIPTS
jgi:hypothetical protein